MKKIDIDIAQFSFAQKLELMETIWADLSRYEKALKSPAWHEAVLKDRGQAYASGKAPSADWEQSKKRIKKNFMKIKILRSAETDLET